MFNCKVFVLAGALLTGLLAGCSEPVKTPQQDGAASTGVHQATGTDKEKQPVKPQNTSKPTQSSASTQPDADKKPVTQQKASVPESAHPAPTQVRTQASQPQVQRESHAAAAPVSHVPENQYSSVAKPAAAHPQSTVSLQIIGDKQHSVILPVQTVAVKDGDTVLDVLTRCLKEKNVQYEYSGALSAAYIKGIDNLYEFDDGPKSGWMFKVNGRFADKSAGGYSVKAGDSIVWMYTVDNGKDIGAK